MVGRWAGVALGVVALMACGAEDPPERKSKPASPSAEAARPADAEPATEKAGALGDSETLRKLMGANIKGAEPHPPVDPRARYEEVGRDPGADLDKSLRAVGAKKFGGDEPTRDRRGPGRGDAGWRGPAKGNGAPGERAQGSEGEGGIARSDPR